jgi:hypothetical protein
MKNISVIIHDEISMIELLMLIYLNECMIEGTQICDKPFRGKADSMLGDFGKQPSIGESSQPPYAVNL